MAVHVDLVTIVFVLVIINLAAPLFVIAHVQLTRTGFQLVNFILAKASQGLSWLLRLWWFAQPDPLLSALSDLSLLCGFALESALLVNFARPMRLTGKLAFGGAFLAICLAAVLGGLASAGLRNLFIFTGFLGMLAFAAVRLFTARDAGRFQKFVAVLYGTVPLLQALFFVALGDEVAKPGQASSAGGLTYYGLLILMQLVGSLGYLLMIKERDTTVLRDQATHDALTAVLNRRAFFQMAETLLANACRSQETVSFIIADLDHFKQINDRLGHQTGDRVLVAFSEAVSQTIRQGDLCARFGGDEFVLFLPSTNPDIAEAIARRIRDELGGRMRLAGLPACTVSMGISSGTPDRPEDLNRLLALADEALYAAKQNGRDRAEWRSLVRGEPGPAASR